MSARIKGLLILCALLVVGITQTTATATLATGMMRASAPPASTDGDDSYSPANSVIRSTNSSRILVSGGGGGFSCDHSMFRGTTPARGLGIFPLSPPVFDGGNPSRAVPCSDSAQDAVTVKSSGVWTMRFVDAANDENQTEPNGGDKLALTVPVRGMVIRTLLGCVRTVAPSSATQVFGTYDDHSVFSLRSVTLPVMFSGPPSQCGSGGMGVIFLSGDYTFSLGLSDT